MANSEPGGAVAERGSSVRYLIASLAGAFAFVSYVQRMNISVAAELMMPDLRLSKTEMGQIFSSFLWGYAIFQLPTGRLGDAIGPRITLSIAALIWGITTVLTGLLPAVFIAGTVAMLGLVAVRFVLGASEAATFPVGSRAIRNWTPPSERAFGNAFMMAGSASAAAASGPLVSLLMVRFGWRWSFYITSLLAFAIAAVWYLAVRDDPREHPWVRPKELRWINPDRQPAVAKQRASVFKVLRDRDILFLSLSYTCEGYVLFIFVNWLYIYLVEERGFSMLNGGLVASLPWLTALVFAPIGGLACDRLSELRGRFAGARTVIIVGYGLSGALLFAAAKFNGRITVIAALCVSVGALYFAEPAFWATAVHLSKENAGAVSAAMNTAGIVGGIVSTSLTPVIQKNFGWLPALGSGAAVAITCAGLWLVIGRRPPVQSGLADSHSESRSLD